MTSQDGYWLQLLAEEVVGFMRDVEAHRVRQELDEYWEQIGYDRELELQRELDRLGL